MAYNNGFPMNYPQMYYQPQYQTPQQPQQPTIPTNNGIIWVQGEAGAKSYIVPPGNTVMLMDSEDERFFLKSADASGMPMPLRIFEYKERTETPSQASSDSVTAQSVNLDNFVTREEFEQRMASVASQCKCGNKAKKKEDVTDGDESAV